MPVIVNDIERARLITNMRVEFGDEYVARTFEKPINEEQAKEKLIEMVNSLVGEPPETKKIDEIRNYLWARDNQLLASEGSCRDTLEGCEEALRAIWCIIEDIKE